MANRTEPGSLDHSWIAGTTQQGANQSSARATEGADPANPQTTDLGRFRLWVRGLAEPKHAWTDTNAAPPRLDPVAATAYTLAGFIPSRLLGFFPLRFGLFISNQGDPVRSLTGA